MFAPSFLIYIDSASNGEYCADILRGNRIEHHVHTNDVQAFLDELAFHTARAARLGMACTTKLAPAPIPCSIIPRT